MIMTLAEAYYIRLGGKVQGPFGIEELHRLAKRGRFSRLWEISEDGVTWHRASEFPELFPTPAPLAYRRGQIKPTDGDPVSEESQDDPSAADVPQQDAAASAEQLWCYYLLDGQEQGSVDFSTLQLMAIGPDDLVWTDGMADWVEARLVAGLVPWQVTAGLVPESDIVAAGKFQSGKVNPLAVVSFLFGLAGISCLFFLGSLVAVVFGHIALRQIGGRQNASRGLAITGLVLGYIGLIVSIIAGFVLLVLSAIQAGSAPMG
jgi:uncharacterized protein DUF4190/uncharacterized protein DUF4339